MTGNEPGPWGPPQSAGPGSSPGAPAGWPPGGYGVPRRTEGLAVASLVLGLSILFMWPLALFLSIAAVITGHMARNRIARSGDQGAGMALAGLIIGYVGIVLSILAIIGISILIFAVGPAVAQDDVIEDAENFSYAITAQADNQESVARDANVVRRAYQLETTDYYGCCGDDDITLADGTPVLTATDADYDRNDWRLQVTRQFIWDKHACLTVPALASSTPSVTEGPCA